MRLLFYIGHPAQYHFFKSVITQLKAKGHQVVILIKTKDVLEKLLINDGIDYENIQVKVRKNSFFSILLASLSRTYKVIKYARINQTDILIGTDASVAQAAYFLRKKSITTLEDDYGVIKKLADLTYPFTSSILVPIICDVGKWRSKKIGYEGYMKLAYLHPNIFKSNENLKNEYIKESNYILIRLSQLAAHHDVGIKGLNYHHIKKIIHISEKLGYKTYISAEAVLQEELTPYQLKIHPEHIHHVLSYAALLISDSQSMSVESAILGIPSIRFSDFSGKISVLEELEHKYRLTFGVKTDNTNKLISLTTDLLSKPNIRTEFQKRRETMLSDKIDVTAFLYWFIINYPNSVEIMKQNPNYQYNFK